MNHIKEKVQILNRLTDILNGEEVLKRKEKKEAARLIKTFSSFPTRVNFTKNLAEKIREDKESESNCLLELNKRMDYGSCRVNISAVTVEDNNTFDKSSLFSFDKIFGN